MANSREGMRRLEGSERSPVSGASLVKPTDPSQKVTITIRVRRTPNTPYLDPRQPAFSHSRKTLSREQFEQVRGAAPKDLESVVDYVLAPGLTVIETSIPRRTVIVLVALSM